MSNEFDNSGSSPDPVDTPSPSPAAASSDSGSAATPPAAAGAGAAAATATAPPPEVEHGTTDYQIENAKRDSWGQKTLHGILDALGGKYDTQYIPTKNGVIQRNVAKTPGSQWKAIIAGALTGAAGGGGETGPGGGFRSFGAGFQARQKQLTSQRKEKRDEANEDVDTAQKAALTQAQTALLTHQVSKGTFDLGRAQVDAAAGDMQREGDFEKVIADGGEGSQDMGIFPDFKSVISAFKEMPELHDHQAGGRLIAIPHIDASGKIDGVHAALVSPDWLSTKINRDLPIPTRSYQDGKLVEGSFTIPAGSLTGDQYAKLVMSQSNEALKNAQDAHEQKTKDSRTKAQNTLDYAEAGEHRAKAKETELDYLGGGEGTGSAGGANMSLVDLIGRGQAPMGRLAYIAARKPELLQAVAKKYPGFDASKVEAYAKVYQDFTASKPNSAGGQLRAGATALGHLSELRRLNTPMSHIAHTPAWTAYQNKAHTLATELAKFYGDATIPAIEKIEDTLMSTLPGNRDAAISTQAQSMGRQFDNYEQQWKNAAPSAAYEAPMPGISEQAKHIRAELDPEYKQRLIEEMQSGTAPLTQPGTSSQPGNAKPDQGGLPQQAITAVQQAAGKPVTFANGTTWKWDGAKAVQVKVTQ
jgi:hypothetical protein